MAIVLFVATSPQASANGGPGAFVPDNYFNEYGLYPQIDPEPSGPSAPIDGLLWLKTGSGAPAIYNGGGNYPKVAYSVYYENTSSQWELLGNYIGDISLAAGWFNYGTDVTVANNDIQYVSTDTVDTTETGWKTFEQGSVYVQFWTDPTLQSTGTSLYSTYAAANSASAMGTSGVYVAQTAPFLVDMITSTGTGSFFYNENDMGMYMPAVVLQKGVAVPEPSTIALVATALLGLMAYAWRKRR
jgi:hypothetical protein